jgi:hypothetical protein
LNPRRLAGGVVPSLVPQDLISYQAAEFNPFTLSDLS